MYLTNANVSLNHVLGQKQLQAISFVSADSMSAFQSKIDVDQLGRRHQIWGYI